MPERAATAQELRALLGPLRRAVQRAASGAEPLVRLTPAQAELLRTVEKGGPLTITQVATRLALARPTVSNLVKDLVEAGMLTREPSPDDQRSVLVDLSPAARAALQEISSGRVAALQGALDQLDTDEHAALCDALPVLRRVLELLQQD